MPGALEKSWAVLLQTRKRDGSWVGTPVNLAVADGCGYFATPADSAKVKRLRNFEAVEVAPCTARGRPTGRERAGRARRLSGDEADAAAAALRRRHPFVHRFLVPLELALKRTHNAYYEVELS
jgi:PPOX class probable F420-dependent enzyme